MGSGPVPVPVRVDGGPKVSHAILRASDPPTMTRPGADRGPARRPDATGVAAPQRPLLMILRAAKQVHVWRDDGALRGCGGRPYAWR